MNVGAHLPLYADGVEFTLFINEGWGGLFGAVSGGTQQSVLADSEDHH